MPMACQAAWLAVHVHVDVLGRPSAMVALATLAANIIYECLDQDNFTISDVLLIISSWPNLVPDQAVSESFKVLKV